MSNNRYTEEFRVEAVRQVVERGHSVAEVASRLGITTHSPLCVEKEDTDLILQSIKLRQQSRLRYEATQERA